MSIDAGGPVEELRVALAVYGDDLEPQEVTELLGRRPSKSFRRGYVAGPRSPEMQHGAWFLEQEAVGTEDPGRVIGQLLSLLPSSRQIWVQLNSRYKVQLRIAVHLNGWNNGFSFDAHTAERIAATGAEVIFDIYSRDGNND